MDPKYSVLANQAVLDFLSRENPFFRKCLLPLDPSFGKPYPGASGSECMEEKKDLEARYQRDQKVQEATIMDLTVQLRSERTTQQDAASRWKKLLEDCDTKTQESKTKLYEYQVKLSELEKAIVRNQTLQKEKEEELKKCEGSNVKLNQDTEQALRNHATERKRLEQENLTLASEKKEIEKSIGETLLNLQAAELNITQLDQNNKDLKNQLQSERTECQTKLEEKEKHLTHEEKDKEAQIQIASLSNEVARTNQIILDQKKLIENYEQRIEDVKKAIYETQEELTEKEDAIREECRKTQTELQQEIERVEAELDRTTDELKTEEERRKKAELTFSTEKVLEDKKCKDRLQLEEERYQKDKERILQQTRKQLDQINEQISKKEEERKNLAKTIEEWKEERTQQIVEQKSALGKIKDLSLEAQKAAIALKASEDKEKAAQARLEQKEKELGDQVKRTSDAEQEQKRLNELLHQQATQLTQGNELYKEVKEKWEREVQKSKSLLETLKECQSDRAREEEENKRKIDEVNQACELKIKLNTVVTPTKEEEKKNEDLLEAQKNATFCQTKLLKADEEKDTANKEIVPLKIRVQELEKADRENKHIHQQDTQQIQELKVKIRECTSAEADKCETQKETLSKLEAELKETRDKCLAEKITFDEERKRLNTLHDDWIEKKQREIVALKQEREKDKERWEIEKQGYEAKLAPESTLDAKTQIISNLRSLLKNEKAKTEAEKVRNAELNEEILKISNEKEKVENRERKAKETCAQTEIQKEAQLKEVKQKRAREAQEQKNIYDARIQSMEAKHKKARGKWNKNEAELIEILKNLRAEVQERKSNEKRLENELQVEKSGEKPEAENEDLQNCLEAALSCNKYSYRVTKFVETLKNMVYYWHTFIQAKERVVTDRDWAKLESTWSQQLKKVNEQKGGIASINASIKDLSAKYTPQKDILEEIPE